MMIIMMTDLFLCWTIHEGLSKKRIHLPGVVFS